MPADPRICRLRDGHDVAIRATAAHDALALQAFIGSLTPASRYQRFMLGLRELPPDMLGRIAAAPRREELALVAQREGRIIGLAQYAASDRERACEVAVVVADDWHRHGLASVLLERLADAALGWGWNEGYADMLRDNFAAIALARRFGAQPARSPNGPGVMRVRAGLNVRATPGTQRFLDQIVRH